MNASTTIVLGAVSSFIATIIFLLLAQVFNKIVLPWFRDQIYRGVRLDGTWSSKEPLPNGDFVIDNLEISQSAERLRGILTLVGQVRGVTGATNFQFDGRIVDGYVVGTSHPLNHESVYHSTFLLSIVEYPDGLHLKGKKCGVGDDTRKIIEITMDFTRTPT